MKKIFIFLAVTLFFGCTKEPSSGSQDDNFTNWSNTLTLSEVKVMYASGVSFMSDARSLSSILPFSYKDSITSLGVIDTSIHYPNTASEGITSVKYKDSLIFQDSWISHYTAQVLSITTIEYGESYGYKLLRISGVGNRLFILNDNNLMEIDLKAYYALGRVKSSNRNGVIILYCFDFVRSNPKYQYFILIDLSSRENKVFRFDYNESLIGG